MKPRYCCDHTCQQGDTCPLRAKPVEQRKSVERRRWRFWLDALFAPGLVSRRRGERRTNKKEDACPEKQAQA